MRIITGFLFILGLMWTLVACEAAPDTPVPTSTNSMVEVGQTTQPVGSFVVTGGGDNTSSGCIDCEPGTSHACSLLSGADSIALIKVPVQEPIRHLLPEDECSGPYSNPAGLLTVDVLGVAWGEPLPTSIQITLVSDLGSANLSPYGSALYFISLRFSGGEAFATHSVPVIFNEGQVQALGTKRYFPNSFEGAVDFLNETWSHWEESCPHHRSHPHTDEEFEARVRDARTMGYDCIPDGPPPAEQPPSEECTDLYPCDP